MAATFNQFPANFRFSGALVERISVFPVRDFKMVLKSKVSINGLSNIMVLKTNHDILMSFEI